jgi:cytochrome P450
MTLAAAGRAEHADLVDLVLAPEFVHDPYPVFARLRAEAPMLWVEPWGCWLMTRAADVDWTIRDTRRFSSTERVARVIRGVPGFEEGRFDAIYENFEVGIAQQDPPAHGRLRSLVSSAFTPRRIENLRPRIQALVDEMLEPHLATGRLELISDLADPLPAIVIAELAGFPVEDRLKFRDWTYRINNIFFGSGSTLPDDTQGDDANAAVLEAREWIADLVAERRASATPPDDLLTALAAAEHEGGRLTTAEMLSVAITLFLGGHDTTTGLIGLGMRALLEAPSQVEVLRERPELIEAAVEEMLRFDAPFQLNLRYVTEDVEVAGVGVAAGSLVRQALGSANRDPERWPDPDAFIVERPAQRHFAFGLGPHFCLGAPLARLQGQVVAETLLRRLPGLRLADPTAPADLRPDITNRNLRSLPLAFDSPVRSPA